jgi:hypothetical protein
MKALILTSVLVTGLVLFSSAKPITDIYSIKEPILTEETYINDIPFDTWEIAVDAILEGDESNFTEESYVDDIPFNTHEIACKYLLKKMIETSGEININDIPFNTERIYCEYLASLIIEQYRNEQSINDLPAEADFTIAQPVKNELPRIEVNSRGTCQEVFVFPGFSL